MKHHETNYPPTYPTTLQERFFIIYKFYSTRNITFNYIIINSGVRN